MNIPRILPFAKSLIEKALKEGDAAIDGTVGNGHDTLFLAKTVGTNGRVYGFDIQQTALDSAQAKLKEENAESQVTFFLAGHESIAEYLPPSQQGTIKAAMFNLGYLPGGNDLYITTPETTIPALEITLDFLAPTGVMTVVLYPVHAGGQEETDAVIQWAKGLNPKKAEVLLYDFINRKKTPPILLVIEKKA